MQLRRSAARRGAIMSKLTLAKNTRRSEADVQLEYYKSLTHEQRCMCALEMATKIKERRGHAYALAGAIVQQLRPVDGDDSNTDYNALSLAEVLEEYIGNLDQEFRLAKCIEAMEAAE